MSGDGRLRCRRAAAAAAAVEVRRRTCRMSATSSGPAAFTGLLPPRSAHSVLIRATGCKISWGVWCW